MIFSPYITEQSKRMGIDKLGDKIPHNIIHIRKKIRVPIDIIIDGDAEEKVWVNIWSIIGKNIWEPSIVTSKLLNERR